jgi:hypothetical protein
MIRSLKSLSVLALVLSPALAFARTPAPAAHQQSVASYHDHSSRVHYAGVSTAHH